MQRLSTTSVQDIRHNIKGSKGSKGQRITGMEHAHINAREQLQQVSHNSMTILIVSGDEVRCRLMLFTTGGTRRPGDLNTVFNTARGRFHRLHVTCEM